MAEKVTYNFLRFRGERVQLDGGAFEWSAGFKPNVNRVRITATGFAALVAIGIQTPGKLEFFCSNDLTPDLVIEEQRVIEATVGAISGTAGAVKAVDYLLQLADRREEFQPPRGGVLGKGPILNPTSTGANSQQKTKKKEQEPAPLTNKEVLDYVLGLLGINPTFTEVPAGVDDLPPLRNRQWHGGSAVAEAEKLFEEFGLVLCPQFDGGFKVHFIGEAPDPIAIETADVIPTVNLPGIDRRGQTVVLKSVEPVLETITQSGVGDGGWEWVAQDPVTDEWDFLDAILERHGFTVRDLIENLTVKLPANVVKSAGRLREQLWRMIGLPAEQRQETFYRLLYRLRPPGTVQVAKTNFSTFGPSVEAKIARLDPQTRLWTNSSGPVTISVKTQMHGWILDLGQNCFQVAEPTDDWRDNFLQLGKGDLRVTFTRKRLDPTTKDPEYFLYGLQQTFATGVKVLTDAQCKAALRDPKTVVLHRPDFKLVYDPEATAEQQEAVLTELRAKADAAVRPWVAGSGEPARQISAVGFVAVELSGKVQEVKFTQVPPRTDAQVQTWFLPSSARVANLRGIAGLKVGEAWPGQQTTAAAASAEGAAGHVQPAVTVGGSTTSLPESPRIFPVLVTVDGGEAGGPDKDCSWTYKLEGITGTEIKGAVRKRPVQKRFAKCEYNRPDDRSLGIAYRDQEGVTQLAWAAQEIPATDRVDVITSVYWDDARKALVTTKRATLVLETDESSEQLVQFYNCDGGTT
jgi:hypothetical protein